MKKTIFLSVLLLAITVAAVRLGWERQLSEVDRFAERVPIEETPSADPRPSQADPSAALPRFIPDAPLQSESSSASGKERESASAETGEISGPESAPSSAASSPAAQSEPGFIAPVDPAQSNADSGQQIRDAADEHIRELDALIARMNASVETLSRQAMTDYRMLTDPNDDAQVAQLIGRYLPKLYELEQEVDEEADAILQNLTDALLAAGGDASLSAQKRLDFEAAKAAQLGYYKELASAYVRQSAGT